MRTTSSDQSTTLYSLVEKSTQQSCTILALMQLVLRSIGESVVAEKSTQQYCGILALTLLVIRSKARVQGALSTVPCLPSISIGRDLSLGPRGTKYLGNERDRNTTL